jgi:hypothetical protein
MICRHCQKASVSRPRGLCWVCYYAPGVRALYPSTSKYAKRGVANFTGPAKTPRPTVAAPGTEEKIAILMERARNRQELFHPADGPRPLAVAG